MIDINVNNFYKKISDEGAIYIDEFLNQEEIKICLNDFKFKSSFNTNNSFTNYYENQTFISQPFLKSKKMFEVISNTKFQDLYSKLLHNFTLRSSRYYETFKGGEGNSFLWHHDEKSNENLKKTKLKSIILIIYFSDVLKIEDGPFQFIKGSHKYSHKYQDLNSRSKDSTDFRKINIEKKFGDRIVTVLGKAGTALIADGRVIHRATKRISSKSRKVFFMQVCSLESNLVTERILFDPSFVNINQFNNLKKIFLFFGYGFKNTNSNFPPSKLMDQQLKFTFIYEICKWIVFRTLKFNKRIIFKFIRKYK